MSSEINEERVNMVPLIDTMFFLIMFFMIVSKFTPDEKAISSILPTDKGQMATTPSKVAPVEQINICIYPKGIEKGNQPSQYRTQLQQMLETNGQYFINESVMRVGGSAAILVNGQVLTKEREGSNVNREKLVRDQVLQVHEYIKTELASREQAGKPRKEQLPVVISCYSGLPWKYAMLAYDAVRAYEAGVAGGKINRTNFDLQEAREVSFAPPRVRNYSLNELGNELFEIVHLR
jgi:biopolymer transport protein ExbD